MAPSKRSALGNNPLTQGIFTKTEEQPSTTETATIETRPQTPKAPPEEKSQDSIIKNKESRFLKDKREEKVNLRLSIRVNDWLDSLLKKGKRKHGQKIPKEVWVQAALELFKSMPVTWEDVESEEQLQTELLKLESRIKILDS